MIDIGGVVGSPFIGVLLDYACPGAPFLGVTVILVIGTLAMALFSLTAHFSFVLNVGPDKNVHLHCCHVMIWLIEPGVSKIVPSKLGW